jgi:hypothetical protein
MAFVDLIAAGVAAAAEAAATAGTVIGNVGGAVAASALPASLGGGAAGAGGIGSLMAATEAGTAGGILSGTALAPEALAGVPLSDVAAMGTAGEVPGSGGGLAGEAGSAGAPALPASTSATGGGFTGFGKFGDTLATNAILNTGQQGLGAIQQEQGNAKSRKVGNQIAAQQGWAQGGYATLHAAHGGSVHVRDGSFVIPADVVSALGNGSSKAGARFLTHLFASLERGPAPEAGNLAADRAMQRHARRSAA